MTKIAIITIRLSDGLKGDNEDLAVDILFDLTESKYTPAVLSFIEKIEKVWVGDAPP